MMYKLNNNNTAENIGREKFKQIIISQLCTEKKGILLAIICLIGFTLLTLLTPWPLKLIFDYILLSKPVPEHFFSLQSLLEYGERIALIILVSSIVVIALIRSFFAYIQTFITAKIGYHLVFKLRVTLFDHIQNLSLSFHRSEKRGEILNKLTSDTDILKDVFAESVLTIAAHFLTVVSMFIVMLLLNWQLSLTILFSFPVLLWGLYRLFAKIKISVRAQRKKEGGVASRAAEILSSVSLIQAYGRENYETERFEKESHRTLEDSVRSARLESLAAHFSEVISAIGMAIVLYVGALQVSAGHMTPGDVLIFAAYITSIYKPIRQIAKLSTKFSRASISVERLSSVFAIQPDIENVPDAIKVNHLEGNIKFNSVQFSYNKSQKQGLDNTDELMIRDLSFSINAGEKIAFVGASGAGKSTIINLLLRLYDPIKGEIFIDGIDLKQYQRESYLSQLSVVLQEAILFGTSIKKNIAYGKLDATENEIIAAAKLAIAHEFITKLPDGYDTIIAEGGSSLSGGQCQRISIARALIRNPSILIFDEPTSALDAESSTLITETIRGLQKNRTIIVVAHHFANIINFDQIMVLRNGKIAESGTHEQLMKKKGYYFEMYSKQFHENIAVNKL